MAMAKVKRLLGLLGGKWDLSLGAVQHTSRWGTIARAKGSTLRYYPDCPWEKPRRRPREEGPERPPSPGCRPGCLPPAGRYVEVLVLPYTGPVEPFEYGAGLYLGMKPSDEDRIYWDFLSWPSWCCPFGIEWSIGPVDNGWLVLYWRIIAICAEGTLWYAVPIPGCTQRGQPYAGYPTPLRYTDPPNPWPGPRQGCLYATCDDWYVCGDNTGFLLPENLDYINPYCL
jgi:hypothetical protein